MFDFDLPTIDTLPTSCAGARMDVVDLTGKPLLNSKRQPSYIVMYGPDSPQYQQALHEQTMRRIQLAKDGATPTPGDSRAEAIEVMAACAKEWNFLARDGSEIPVTVESARALFTGYPAIYEQADLFLSRRVNFLPVSSEA